MRAAAYAYAEGGPEFDELVLSWAVSRYGAQSVYGRPLSFQEIRSMAMAENVVNAHKSRDAYRDKHNSENWAEWAGKNPKMSRLLDDAARAYEEMG